MLTDADCRAVKAAFRDMIRRVGGMESAASLLAYPAGHLSVAASLTHMQTMPRIDHVVALEAMVGEPLVTAIMARAQGWLLAPRGAGRGDDVPAVTAALADAGGFVSAAAVALADGDLCPRDRAELQGRAAQLGRALAVLELAVGKGPQA